MRSELFPELSELIDHAFRTNKITLSGIYFNTEDFIKLVEDAFCKGITYEQDRRK